MTGVVEAEEAEIGGYRIERRLGAGGMAEVFLARRVGPHGFRKRVAIKRILPRLAADPSHVRMFTTEARAASLVTHPNVVQTLDLGEHRGRLYIVMEYVEGATLSALLRAAAGRGERLPLSVCLHVVREMLLGLGAVHSATDEEGAPLELVHRDVSPSNVLLSRAGDVKLSDFGVVRAERLGGETSPGQLKGKLRYLAPEQLDGRPLDARTDIFAAGVVLAEMLLGQALFRRRTDLARLDAISRGALRDPSLALPAEVALVLEVALALDPAARFPSALDFSQVLDDLAESAGLRLAPTGVALLLAELGLTPGSGAHRRVAPAAPRAPSPSGTYRLRSPRGEDLGAVPRAELLARLATGELGADSEVATTLSGPRPLGEVAQLGARARSAVTAFHTDDSRVPELAVRAAGLTPARLAFSLTLAGRTGLLLHVDGATRRRIFFQDGAVVAVASTVREELLGCRLAAAGLVSRAEIEHVLSYTERRLGEALVARAALAPGALAAALAEQWSARLLPLFAARSGELRFFPGVAAPDAPPLTAVEPPAAALARLALEACSPATLAALLRPLAQGRLRAAEALEPLAGRLALAPAEARALALAGGAPSLAAAAAAATRAGVGLADSLRALYLGVVTGALVVDGAPCPPR